MRDRAHRDSGPRRWRARLNAALLTQLVLALGRCSPRVACGVVEAFGRLRYSVSWQRRRLVRRRASEVFGLPAGSELEGVVRRVFVNRLMNLAIPSSFARCREGTPAAHVSVEGRHHLDQGLEQGRGAILLGTHMGFPGVICYFLRDLGYPLVRVGVAPDNARLRRLDERVYAGLARSRQASFEDIFLAEDGSPRTLALQLRSAQRALQANKVVFIGGEGLVGAQPVPTAFFGKRVGFPRGWVSLARITGAPVLFTFATRCRSAAFRIRCEPALSRSLIESQDAALAVGTYAQWVEERVRQRPCHAGALLLEGGLPARSWDAALPVMRDRR